MGPLTLRRRWYVSEDGTLQASIEVAAGAEKPNSKAPKSRRPRTVDPGPIWVPQISRLKCSSYAHRCVCIALRFVLI